MNIQDKHLEKAVSTYSLFIGAEENVIALQIQKGEQLKEHIIKTEAFFGLRKWLCAI